MTGPGRGLAPFDQPVFLRDDAPTDQVLEPERDTAVLAFVCRAALVVAMGATLPFLTPADIRLPATISIALYIPTVSLLDRHRSRDRRHRVGALIVLIDHVFLVHLSILGDRLEILGTVGVLAIVFHRWLYGRRMGVLSITLLAASAVALAAEGSVTGDWFTIVTVMIAGGLLVWLLDDQLSRHERVSHGFRLASGRAEAVLAGVGDAIITTGVDGRIRHLNPAALRMLGCTPETGRGGTCADLVGLRSENRPLSCNEGCALLGHGNRNVEVWRTGRQGERQPLLAEVVPLYDEHRSVVEIVHSFRDITALKQADEAKTLFLATASHELKTPLAVIHGFAQLLERDDLDPVARARAIASIQSRSNHLAAIVDRLLMSSRIESGRIHLAPALGPVGELVIRRAEDFAASSGREVTVAIDPELPDAWVDVTAFTTVLDHLFDNAVKYSPGGGPIIVTARPDGDGEHVSIDVADEGIGMTEEQIEHCFDRFWQAEGTDVRRFGGTGIGLYIVRSLVEAMDGSISVSSAAGDGTRFAVRLRIDAPTTTLPADPVVRAAGEGEQSMIREFMRQMGVLETTVEVPR